MKILIVTDAWHPQINGVVRTYEHLGEELQKQGHDVEVIGPESFPWRLPLPGYKEIQIALFPYRRLRTLMDKSGAESIHIATEGPLGWAARRYCLKRRRRFSTSYHTQFPDYIAKRFARPGGSFYRFLHSTIKNLVCRFHKPSSGLMVTTKSIEDQLKSWGVQAPIYRVARGADLSLFSPDGDASVYGDLKRPVALCVSRIAVEKNLEAFLDMDWDGSKVIIGDGPALPALKRQYPDIFFPGKKTGEDLAAHYRDADIFVFPSKTETFGIVLIEALASGLPVAAYKAPGPIDILTEPFLGAITDSNLAAAAQTALQCGTKDQRTDFVKTHYTWETAAHQFLQLLEETAEKKESGTC